MSGPAVTAVRPRSLRTTLGCFRYGGGDPTTVLRPGLFARATHTPDGPGTVLVRWDTDTTTTAELRIDAWGPGADWMASRVEWMTGDHDPAPLLAGDHPAVSAAQRDHGSMRIGASGDLYHELLPTVLGQRITGAEAVRQWRRLCLRLGDVAPGPLDGMRLPPAPAALARRPTWWFHPLGIEAGRARTITQVARHADRLWDWAAAGSAGAAGKLALLPGVGCWTVGSVLGPALGDADAVPVGDYHFPSLVAWHLAGEARADDARMLALLAPYTGQRGRVIRLLGLTGRHAPAFGPRQRILPMHRW